jgi:hypothetical protein
MSKLRKFVKCLTCGKPGRDKKFIQNFSRNILRADKGADKREILKRIFHINNFPEKFTSLLYFVFT